MPGSAAHDVGDRADAVVARSRRCPGCGPGPPRRRAAASPGTSRVHVGSPLTSTSKRSPAVAEVQAGSRSSSPISQLTRAVMTGSPSTVAGPGEPLRRDQARLDDADRGVDRARSRPPPRCAARSAGRREAELGGDHLRSTAGSRRRAGPPSGSCSASSGGCAEQHDVAQRRRARRSVRMSLNSSARTCVMRDDSADTISGKRSVMPPGWMPVPCSVDAAGGAAPRAARRLRCADG